MRLKHSLTTFTLRKSQQFHKAYPGELVPLENLVDQNRDSLCDVHQMIP